MAYALKIDGNVIPLTGLVDPKVLIEGWPQHHRLRARRAGAAGHPEAVRHQPLAVVEHRQPAGPAVLPAGGAGAGGARLQEPVPDHHHAVHRRATPSTCDR
jgi:hypothetical protein